MCWSKWGSQTGRGWHQAKCTIVQDRWQCFARQEDKSTIPASSRIKEINNSAKDVKIE